MRRTCILLIAALAGALPGCGGGGDGASASHNRSGVMVIRVKWPAAGRLISQYANSISVTAVQNDPGNVAGSPPGTQPQTLTQSKLIVRPDPVNGNNSS